MFYLYISLTLIWWYIFYKLENCKSISQCMRKSGSIKGFLFMAFGIPFIIFIIINMIF